MAIKQNDWVATIMYQPNMSLDELNSVGITVDNTQLQDREYYKNIDAVKNTFQTDGKFDEKAYNSFYDQALLLYNEYANKSAADDFINTYKYDPMDWRHEKDNKVDVSSTMIFERNPMGNSINTKALGIATDSGLSMREIAQTNRVFNYEENKWEDWTPNEKGGLSNIFTRPTLVMATYDEDGTHVDEYGRIVEHKKGDFKFDPSTGKPFYETLGNREIYNKDVLHISDTLTDDGSKINKFDFFDSDSLDKSVGGSVMKLTASIAPTFIGLAVPELGLIYGGISALIALTQLMPTLGKAVNGFITNDNEDAKVGKALNKAEAWAARFEKSVSDHSREKTVTIENAAGLIKYVAMQLFQQRSIQSIPRLFKNNPNIYNNVELAKQLSYVYMSGTSALESYSAFKQAGANDRVAGLGMLATTGAFYKLMSIDYFRDSFFKGSWFDDNNVKSPVWKVAQDFMDSIKADGKLAEDIAKNTVAGNQRTLKSLTKRFVDAINKTGKPWAPATFWERSFAEGVEETMEEAMQDSIKGLFAGAEAIGIPMNKEREKLDFGFSGKDFLTRYGMAFGGGLVGGAIFQGYNDLGERIDRARQGLSDVTNDSDANLTELVKLISDGRKEEILDTLEKWHRRQRFGSNSLAATKLATVSSADGNSVVSNPSSSDSISQNDFIYNALVKQVNNIDDILTSENFKQSQIRQALLKSANEETPELNVNLIRGLELHSLVLKDLNRLGTKIVSIRKQISDRENSFKPTNDSTEAKKKAEEDAKKDTVLKDLNDQLKELRDERDAILNGDRMAYYTSQYSLILNGKPLEPFIGFSNFESFVRLRFGKDSMDLTETQRDIAKKEWEDYKNGENTDLFRAIDVYNALSAELAEDINKAAKEAGSAIIDPDLALHTIGNDYLSMLKSRDEFAQKLKELQEKTTLTEDENKEVSKLAEEIAKLDVRIKADENNPAAMLSNATSREDSNILIEQLISRVNAGALSIDEISELAEKVKNAYKDWTKKKILKTSQPELQTFLQLVANSSRSIKDINSDIDDKLNNLVTEKFGSADNYVETKFGGDNTVDDLFNYDPSHKQPIHERLFSLISQFYDNLRTNPAEALSTYREIEAILKTKLTDDEIKDFLYEPGREILPFVGSQSIDKYLSDIAELQSNLKTSVLPIILSKFKTNITSSITQNILEMLDDEQRRLASKTKLDQYTIDNEAVRDGLTEALVILNSIKGLLLGAADGTNRRINVYKTSDKFAEISEESAKLIASDIDEKINRIAFLLELDARNNGFKLKEHKEIAVNMRVQFFKALTNVVHSEPFKEKFKGIDPAEIWEEIKPAGLDEVTVENYWEFEPIIIQFESELFKKVKALGLSDEEIVNNIFSIFTDDGKHSEIWKQISTNFKRDTDEISDYDLLFYIASILTVDSNEFYSRLKGVVENKFNKAPLYGHEYIVRMGYSMLYNPDVFNMLLDKIADSYPGSDEYISSRKRIKNILFGLGGAGTGKTTSLALLFKELVKEDDVEFIYAASDRTQVDKLCTSLNAESSEQRFTLKDFIKKIAEDQLSNDNIEVQDNNLVFKKPLKISDESIFADTSNIRILIIDEIETLNSLELQILSDYAAIHDVFILGLGDTKQPTAKVKGYSDSFEDIYAIKGPQLFASLRTLSVAKNDNYNMLDTALDVINKKVADNFETLNTNEERNKLTDSYLKEHPITLKYYTEGNRLVGDKVESDENAFKANIDKALSIDGTKVLIVTDKISKYQSDKYTGHPDKIVVRDVANALGGEFDYVFVDMDIDTNNPYSELQKFYMLTQRSTLFTSVLDPTGKYAQLHITSEFKPAANALLRMPKEAIDDFKAWRLKGLEKVTYSEESSKKTRRTFTTPTEVGEEVPEVEEEKEETEDDKSEEGTPSVETPSVETPSTTPTTSPAQTGTSTIPDVNSESETDSSETNDTKTKRTRKKPKTTKTVKETIILPPSTPDVEGETESNDSVEPEKETNNSKLRKARNINSNERSNSDSEPSIVVEKVDEDEIDPTDYAEIPSAKVSAIPYELINSRMHDYFSYIYSNNFISDERNRENSILKKLGIRKNYAIFVDRVSKYICANWSRMKSSGKFGELPDRLKYFWRKKMGDTKTQEIAQYFKDTAPELWVANFNGSNWLTLRLYNSLDQKNRTDYIEIPIMKTTIEKTGFYNGDIKQATDLTYEKGKRITLRQLLDQNPGLDIVSTAGILLDSKGDYEDSEDFIERNIGKCFVAVGNDYNDFQSNDVWVGENSQGKLWTYSHSDVLKLIGVQRILNQKDVIKFLVCHAYLRNTSNDESYVKKLEGWLKAFGLNPNNINEIAKTVAEITGNDEWENWTSETDSEKKELLRYSIATKSTAGIIISRALNEILNNLNKYQESDLWYNIRRRLYRSGKEKPNRIRITDSDGKSYFIIADGEDKDGEGYPKMPTSLEIQSEDGLYKKSVSTTGKIGVKLGESIKSLIQVAGIDLSTSRVWFEYYSTENKQYQQNWSSESIFNFISPFITPKNGTGEQQLNNIFAAFGENFYANIRVNKNPNDTSIWKTLSLSQMYNSLTTDASTWHYAEYTLDESSIVEDENATRSQIDVLGELKSQKDILYGLAKQVLDKKVVDEIFSTYEEFVPKDYKNLDGLTKTIIDAINEQISLTSINKKIRFIEFVYGDIVWGSWVDNENAVANAIFETLGIEPTSLNFSGTYQDKVRTVTIQSEDSTIDAFVYYDSDGDCHVSQTEVAKDFQNLTDILNSIKEQHNVSSYDADILKEFLFKYLTNTVTSVDANRVIDAIDRIPDDYQLLIEFMSKRLNSEIDEC